MTKGYEQNYEQGYGKGYGQISNLNHFEDGKNLHQQNQQTQRSLKSLYKISKIVYKESLLEGSLETSGSQREKFLEELRMNSNSIIRNTLLMKIMAAFFLAFFMILTGLSLQQVMNNLEIINQLNFNTLLFAFSSIAAIVFLIEIVFLFSLGMITLMGLFSGRAFKYLEILPLKNEEISKIAFLAFYKSMDIQLITMFLGLPIISAIVTHSFLGTLVAIVVSGLNLLFSMAIMVFVSRFLAKKVFSMGHSKFKTIIKMTISFLYMFATISVFLVFTYLTPLIQDFFMKNLISGNQNDLVGIILSFIYPFSLTNVFIISLVPFGKLSLAMVAPSLIGTAITVLLIIFLFRKSLNVIRSMTKEYEYESGNLSNGKSGSNKKQISVTKRPPIKAIMKKDISMITRDFALSVWIIIPIVYAIMNMIMGSESLSEGSIDALFENFTIVLYTGISIVMVVMAVTGAENNSGEILQSLPIRNSDVYKAKRNTMIIIVTLSLILPLVYYSVRFPQYLDKILIDFCGNIVIMAIGIETILICYARLFGKIRNEYTLQQLNPGDKFTKIMVGVAIELGIVFTPWLISILLKDVIYPGVEIIPIIIYILKIFIAVAIFIPIKIISLKTFNRNQKTLKIQ